MSDHNYRNRALLNLASELPCMFGIYGVCEGGRGEPCHSNQARHGKGKSLKAHDLFFAAGCRACHRELDQGTRFTREEKAAMWQDAFERTLLTLFQRNLVGVL